jgi:hypothetical protein
MEWYLEDLSNSSLENEFWYLKQVKFITGMVSYRVKINIFRDFHPIIYFVGYKLQGRAVIAQSV